MNCLSTKREYILYDNSGVQIGSADHHKQLPAEWQLKKAPKKGSKPSAFVFTTLERSVKQSKYIENWEQVPLGTQFWLKDGSSMLIAEPVAVNDKLFRDIFGKCRNRFESSRKFLELSDSQQADFSLLSTAVQIELLHVPVKFHKQFNAADFGLQQLQKYCDYIAHSKDRREAEAAKRRQEQSAAREREYKLLSAERTETELVDYVDYDTRNLYVVDNRTPVFIPILELLYGNGDRLSAAERLDRPVKFPVEAKYTGNDAKWDDRFLNRLVEARRMGLVNKDVLGIIYQYYVWRFNNQIVPVVLN